MKVIIMKTKSILGLILTLSFITACAPPTSSGTYPPPISLPVSTATPENYPAPTSVPTEAAPTSAHIPVDLTPAQRAAIEAVAKKYNIPSEQIHIVSTEAVTWPNGCLGVVIPGVMCTEVITDGFRIKLEANGQPYEVHTNQDGTSVVDAAQQLATLSFVVHTSAGLIQVVNPNIPLGPTYNPSFNGFFPQGSAILGTAYVLDLTTAPRVVAIDGNGSRELTFIKNSTYGLAIWRGGLGTQPLLAWGTLPSGSDHTTSLQISNPDGSNLETLLTVNADKPAPIQLVAEFWSADGDYLYFSKEPSGIGGYILFGGASNLYEINIATKVVNEILPQASPTGQLTCLDAVSGDYRFVADHCAQNVITIRDLTGGASVTILPPADVTGYHVVGSARFSPAGDRVAFALAKRDPSNEQGWVAVGNSSGGTSNLILVGDPGSYYTVAGWLDDQTLLVQSTSIADPSGGNQLYTVDADGSNLTKVADGTLLTVIDNR